MDQEKPLSGEENLPVQENDVIPISEDDAEAADDAEAEDDIESEAEDAVEAISPPKAADNGWLKRIPETVETACKRSYAFLSGNAKIVVAAVFILLFVAGTFIVEDYGLGNDDYTEWQTLRVNVEYVAKKFLSEEFIERHRDFFITGYDLPTYFDKEYGVAVMAPTAFAHYISREKLGNVERSEYFIFYRHYYTMAVSVLALFCLYLILKRLTKRRLYALLGVLLAILTPRFLAEYCFNVKDILAFDLTLILMYFTVRFFGDESFPSAIFLGIAAAFAVNTRISIGVFLVLALAYYVAAKLLTKSLKLKSGLLIGTSVGIAAVSYYVITPSAWEDPIGLVSLAFDSASDFSRWGGTVFYMGEIFSKARGYGLPWHYLPVMLIVTTPIIILVLSLIGCIKLGRAVGLKKKEAFTLQSPTGIILLIAVFGLVSMLVPVLTQSNVYNGWRHLYYVYGGVIILAVIGAKWLLSSKVKWFRAAAAVCIAMSLCSVAVWTVQNHPYQYVYYNELAGSHPADKFETDYWNISVASISRKLLDDTTAPNLYVLKREASYYEITMAGLWAHLEHQESYRLKLRNVDEVMGNAFDDSSTEYYYIINPMYHKINEMLGDKMIVDELGRGYEALELIDEIIVSNEPIMQVYKLQPENIYYLYNRYYWD